MRSLIQLFETAVGTLYDSFASSRLPNVLAPSLLHHAPLSLMRSSFMTPAIRPSILLDMRRLATAATSTKEESGTQHYEGTDSHLSSSAWRKLEEKRPATPSGPVTSLLMQSPSWNIWQCLAHREDELRKAKQYELYLSELQRLKHGSDVHFQIVESMNLIEYWAIDWEAEGQTNSLGPVLNALDRTPTFRLWRLMARQQEEIKASGLYEHMALALERLCEATKARARVMKMLNNVHRGFW